MALYKYIIGWLYYWGLKKGNDTPVANVVFTMCMVHYFLAFTVYMVFRRIFDFRDVILGVNRMYIGLLLIAVFVVYYFLFFNRDKWEGYAQQVEQENERKRRRGKFLVLLYLIGSILLFFISLPFVFS